MSRRTVIAALTLMCVAALTGCSASSGLAVLDTEQTAADTLPPLEDQAYEPADEPTSRFIGEHDDIAIWVSRGTDAPACLIAVDRNDDWIVGCGALPLRVSSLGHTFELNADGTPTPEGMTRVSDNVSMR